MSLELVTAGLKEKVGEDCGLGAILKFDFGDEGILVLDASQVPNVINNDDAEAACTMVLSLANFMDMADGNIILNVQLVGGLEVVGTSVLTSLDTLA